MLDTQTTSGPPAWVSPPLLSAIMADIEEMIQGKIIASLAFINAPITAETIPDIISWQRLEAACLSCEEYTLLHQLIEQGVPEEKNSLDSTSKICLSMCLSGIGRL